MQRQSHAENPSRYVRYAGRGFLLVVATAVCALMACVCPAGERVMEKLDRGVVAVPRQEGGVFVSWRNLVGDPPDVTYNVYRSTDGAAARKLNGEPLAGPTCYVDSAPVGEKSVVYTVRAVVAGREQAAQGSFATPTDALSRPYLSIPMQMIDGYAPNDASVGDLDGDGQYEIVLHQAGRGHDNSHGGPTDPPIFQAYELDGTLLWTINLGRNIREGAHYTQFMVYDLDGDGKAEVACKTADGTTDGKGNVIGDPKANWLNKDGRPMSGPEYLTVFDGQTGAALATAPYVPARHPTNPLHPTGDELKAVWGDGYGNRGERYLACVAYLDGKLPSLVMCRGYYTRTVLAAWNWRGGKLTSIWTFDSDDPAHPENKAYGGQGNHNLSVADVDGDGRDEIVYGGMCLDDNGKGLYSTGLGHGDAAHLTDLDPDRPGLENWSCQECKPYGAVLRDARTGETIFRQDARKDTGRACAADIDPRHPGYELWASTGCPLFDVKGNALVEKHHLPINFTVNWDGDLLQELLDGTRISKYNWETGETETLLDVAQSGCVSNNWSKANPCLSADILGDWREEVIWRTKDNTELRIYTTTIPTKYRLPCLMQDPQYRLSVAWQNVGYNQPPHTSYYLGAGMKLPPQGR